MPRLPTCACHADGPQGWIPPEPCRHEWVDVTELGFDGTCSICKWCGDEVVEDRVFRN